MSRIRKGVAGVVAVATLSSGAAACTPVQTQSFFDMLGRLITLILYAQVAGHPVPPATPTTVATVPVEPIGT